MKLNKGDIVMRVKHHLSAVCWKDKRDVFVLTNMHAPPVEGHFVDEAGHAVKPYVTEDYNTHMGYVDKSDRMANSLRDCQKNLEVDQEIVFTLTGHDHFECFYSSQVVAN
jgi:hypothetical protein